MASSKPPAYSAPVSDVESLKPWRAQRDRLKALPRHVATERVSRDYGSAEIADLQQEIDRLEREIAARQAQLGL